MANSTVEKPSEYNPFTAGGDERIIDTYRWLRDEHPVYHNERYGLYAVSRYEDVRQVSRDWETFTNAKGVDVDHTALLGGPNFVEMDPPEHDKWRRFFQPRFSAKAIREDLLPIIDAEVQRLLDEAVAEKGTTIDLAADFAWKLAGRRDAPTTHRQGRRGYPRLLRADDRGPPIRSRR
jgi:cytochrome P450